MPRVIKSREEFEGEIYESLVLVEGKDLSLHAAGTEFTEISKSRRRVDGMQRVTGRARYTQDVYPPGMLYVRVLRSPYPRARVRRIDTKKAEKLPGVRDILHRFNAPKAAFRGEETVFREEVRFVGDEVAAVAADDEQTAVEALRLIEVDYELLPHVVDLEEAIGDMAPRLDPDGNVAEAATHKRGDAKRALKEADFVVDATYRTSTQIHNSLETHGAVATWDGDQLTVYESTQHTFAVRQGLRTALKLPFSKIRVLCDYMGGGFGSKGGVGKHSIISSLFAMRLGRPVRYVLTREEENIAAGNRSATLQQMRIGGKGGRITGLEHISWANVGQGKWVANPTGPTNTLYDIANLSSKSYRSSPTRARSRHSARQATSRGPSRSSRRSTSLPRRWAWIRWCSGASTPRRRRTRWSESATPTSTSSSATASARRKSAGRVAANRVAFGAQRRIVDEASGWPLRSGAEVVDLLPTRRCM